MKTWLACLLVVAAAAPLSAQQVDPVRRSADFLFGRPKAAVAVRGSWIFANASSDLFDFVTEHLTIDKGDFNVPAIAADVAIAITPRVDAQVGVEVSRMLASSEYRHLVDNQFLPIEQQTRFKTVHLTGGVRYALTPKGYEVSRLAWVPRRVIPFVGAGAGAVFYQFRQTGDFVDFVDSSVFSDSFRAQGWAPTAYASGGVDIQLYRGLYATTEGRYTKAAGKLGSDFIGFDPIDLSGFRMSAGINLVF